MRAQTERESTKRKVLHRLTTILAIRPDSSTPALSPSPPFSPSTSFKERREAALRERGLLPARGLSEVERGEGILVNVPVEEEVASEARRIKEEWEMRQRESSPPPLPPKDPAGLYPLPFNPAAESQRPRSRSEAQRQTQPCSPQAPGNIATDISSVHFTPAPLSPDRTKRTSIPPPSSFLTNMLPLASRTISKTSTNASTSVSVGDAPSLTMESGTSATSASVRTPDWQTANDDAEVGEVVIVHQPPETATAAILSPMPRSPTKKRSTSALTAIRRSLLGSSSTSTSSSSITPPDATTNTNTRRINPLSRPRPKTYFDPTPLPSSPPHSSSNLLHPSLSAPAGSLASSSTLVSLSAVDAGRRRTALNPTIHSRGSILIEAGGISDDESRRLSEMAFLS